MRRYLLISPYQRYPSLKNSGLYGQARAHSRYPENPIFTDDRPSYVPVGRANCIARTGTHVDASAETFYQNGTSLKGTITGDITKGSLINLTVTRGSKYPPLLLSGSVGPDNRGHGAYTYENHDTALWDMNEELNCVPVPPPPAPAPAPAPDNRPVAGPDKPAAKTLGTATVVADTDMYDKPDGQ